MIAPAGSRGPKHAPTSRPLTGLEEDSNVAYRIAQEGAPEQRMRLRAVEHDIALGEVLRYAVFPAFDDTVGPGLGYGSTGVAVDLLFDDGGWLSDLSARDEAGFGIGPREQFVSNVLSVDQWNEKIVDLSVAVGRTVVELDLVSWRSRPTASEPHGWVSDVTIGPGRMLSDDPVERIDIRRGTNSSSSLSRGNCAPAVTVPHGFNFGIPVTNADDMSWAYQYHANNDDRNLTPLQALVISHTATNWGSERNVLHVMPSPDIVHGPTGRDERALGFRHSDEEAHPYLYSVTLPNDITASMTSTDHVVAMRFSLPPQGGLILDQFDTRGSLVIDPADPTCQISGFNESRVGENPTVPRMFFAITCDRPIRYVRSDAVPERPGVSAAVGFEGEGPVVLRIATSFISLDQAKHSLALEMPAEVSFDDVVEQSKSLWRDKLGLVTIEGVGDDRAVSFASGMYRMFMYPNHASENAGDMDNPRWVYADVSDPRAWEHTSVRTGCDVRHGRSYVNNGFWDTYRTVWPAYCLFEPEEAAILLDGFVEHYRASGWIDRWCAPGPTGGMVGSSADIVIAHAMASGVDLLDAQSAYDAALRDATTVSNRMQVGRFDNEHAMFRGYVSTATEEGMSWSLEDALNDFGIARASRWMLKHADESDSRKAEYEANALYFENRAKSYLALFNTEVGFFMGRDGRGRFRCGPAGFDPRVWGGDYTETNAWGMAVSVPHDGYGLASLYGGPAGLEAKLDQYFSTPETAHFVGSYNRVIHEMVEARDIRMGMYGLSNQPAHHIAYMYAFTPAPYKTQAIVREAVRRLFLGSAIGQGYPGDEDNGEMSAWFVFSAVGLYPLTPASGEMLITAPSVPHTIITPPQGGVIDITACHWSQENVYIQSVRVNGEAWNSPAIPIALLRQGVQMVIDLGPRPSRWADAAAAPYSLTRVGARPHVRVDATTPQGAETGSRSSCGDAAAVFDDSFNGGLIVGSGDWVSYDFGGTMSFDLYTVSLGDVLHGENGPGVVPGWEIETSDDASTWVMVDQQDHPRFRWNDQMRAFRISGSSGGRYVRFRIIGGGALDLRQLEFFPR